MRTSHVALLFLAAWVSLSVCARASEPPVTSAPRLPLAAQSSISEALGRDLPTYHAYRAERGFRARNAHQQIDARFEGTGISLRKGDSEWKMVLERFGYGSSLKRVARATPQASLNRVEYRRGLLTEWYVNGPIGLEQGFTVTEPPVREANDQPLTFELAYSGDLTAVVDESCVALMLNDHSGKTRMRYVGLTAHDRTGKELHAWLEVRGRSVFLEVADKGALYPLVVDPLVELAELTASDGAPNDSLGSTIAMNGNTVVVGAPSASIGSNQSQGAAYVFVKPANGWTNLTQAAKLTASDGQQFDEFGLSVAIGAGTIVVGSAVHPYTNGPGPGAAYVFVEPAGGWTNMTETAELTASTGGQIQYFGNSVSYSANTVVVGAYEAKGGQGSAYVFVKPANGWQTTTKFNAQLYASDSRYQDRFGTSVALGKNAIIVGAPEATIGSHQSQGAAYIFAEPTGGWKTGTETAKLTASNGESGNFLGTSVGINGSTAVVGATITGSRNGKGAAYVFVEPTSGWVSMTETAELKASDGVPGDGFASVVAVQGSLIVVAAPLATVNGNSIQGAAYTFAMPQAGWRTTSHFTSKLTLEDGMPDDAFGASVCIAGDTIVLGATGVNNFAGAAYVFGP